MRDADRRFESLGELERSGSPYILIVPPLATSSGGRGIPLGLMKNARMVVEDTMGGGVHEHGATGVDRFTRAFIETGMPFMEGHFCDSLLTESRMERIGSLHVYRGSFVGATCSGPRGKRGILYAEHD